MVKLELHRDQRGQDKAEITVKPVLWTSRTAVRVTHLLPSLLDVSQLVLQLSGSLKIKRQTSV